MKASSVVLLFSLITVLNASDVVDRAHRLETSGDVQGARVDLAAGVQRAPGDIAALTEYASFLNRYGDPDSRAAYARLLEAVERSGDRDQIARVAGQLVVLDLETGDRDAALKHLEA